MPGTASRIDGDGNPRGYPARVAVVDVEHRVAVGGRRERELHEDAVDLVIAVELGDEVEKLRPWALGEPRHGYATVNYAKLSEAA